MGRSSMHKLMLGWWLAILAFSMGQASAQTPAPEIKFQSEVFDFGRLPAGQVVTNAFIFTNTGNATLEVLNVSPSCGCTTAGDWSRRVEPGMVGFIPVQFNSSTFSGPIHKTVTVASNDKQRPSLTLQITGTVWKAIEVQPQFAAMTMGPDATDAATMVRIVNNTDEPLVLSPPDSPNPAFKTELEEVSKGKEYHLKIRVSGPLPQGNTQSQITMKTGITNPPAITAVAWVNVQPALMVMPSQMSLPPGPLPAPATPSLIIQNNSTNALELSEAKINAKGAEVKINETQPGRTFNVLVTFPQGFQAPPNEKVELTIKTTSAKTPLIRVPIVQFTRSGAPVTGSMPGLPPAPIVR